MFRFILPILIFALSAVNAHAIAIGSDDAKDFTADNASGTLPILYINTQDSAPVVDKINKIPATMWIEIPEDCPLEISGNGSETEPLTLTIKGRGNASWFNSEKKPYKLKLDNKAAILGMPKHKHWALIPHNAGFTDQYNTCAGFAIAEEIGLGWVPRYHAVEVVPSGEYVGLYSIVESIKIDANRLDIFEQPENNVDPETIPYGWFVEFDNYPDEFQITIPEREGINLRVTHKSPEVVSEQQQMWLTDEFTRLNSIIYSSEPAVAETWDDYIDASSVAKYVIIRELMHDFDGYSGSMNFHRDLPADGEESSKWIMGPIWDICLQYNKGCWAFDGIDKYGDQHWIESMSKTQAFVDAMTEEWEKFYPEGLEKVYEKIDRECDLRQAAELCEVVRWPHLSSDTASKRWRVKYNISQFALWIDENLPLLQSRVPSTSVIEPALAYEAAWSAYTSGGSLHISASAPVEINIFSLSGSLVKSLNVTGGVTVENLPSGIYIVNGAGQSRKVVL